MSFFNNTIIQGLPRSMAAYYRSAAKKITMSRLNLDILERRAKDIEELTGATVSNTFEDAIINGLLPHDPRARHYAAEVLFGKKLNLSNNEWTAYGIQDALAEIFEEVSAGTSWEPRYTNAKPLVDFTYAMMKRKNLVWKDMKKSAYPTELDELAFSFEAICAVMGDAAEKESGSFVALEAKRMKETLLPLVREGHAIPLEIVRTIVSNWDYLQNSTHTFRVLKDVMNACHPKEDTAFDRVEFQNVCEKVMTVWTQKEMEEEIKAEQAKIETQLITYPIADGDVVHAPSNWIVVNPDLASFAHYAGVVEVKNGGRYDAPHFLFFIENHSVREMSDSEENAVIEKIETVWPRLQEVRNDEVELEYGENGGVINGPEYDAAPRIGFFPIYDEGTYPTGRPPYGAVIERKGESTGLEDEKTC